MDKSVFLTFIKSRTGTGNVQKVIAMRGTCPWEPRNVFSNQGLKKSHASLSTKRPTSLTT